MILGILASSISGSKAVTNSYSSIATVTVGSGGASSISFSSIPQTYTHLQIRAFPKNDVSSGTYGSSAITASFNSDTTYTNYRDHYLYADGASVSAGTTQASGYYATVGYIGAAWSNATQTNIFNAVVCDILDYTNTNKYKTVRHLSGKDGNGGGELAFGSSLWMSTSAITSITLYNYLTTRNFVQYSHFALYGIKA